MKLRPGEGRVTLKSTDDKTTLTTRVSDASELKLMEQLVNDYVGMCTKCAPVDADAGQGAGIGAKKGKGKKGKK